MLIAIDGFDAKPNDTSAAAMIRFPWTQLTALAVSDTRSRFVSGKAGVLFSFNSMDYYVTSGQKDTTFVVGFALYVAGSNIVSPTLGFYTDNGANRQFFFTLDYTSTRSIRAFNQSSTSTVVMQTATNVLQFNAWQYFEFKVYLNNSAASGYAEARIDGITQMSGNLKTNNNATVLLWDRINIGTPISTSNINTSPALDDFYLLNTSGQYNSDFLGDVHIDIYYPVASGSYTQWTPSAGSNWQTVDEIPADTSDYNYTSTSGAIDTFTFSSLPEYTSRIYAVELIQNAGKTGSQLRTLAPIIVYSGVTATGIFKAQPQNSFVYQSQIFDYNPVAASGWTASGVMQSQFGYIAN